MHPQATLQPSLSQSKSQATVPKKMPVMLQVTILYIQEKKRNNVKRNIEMKVKKIRLRSISCVRKRYFQKIEKIGWRHISLE